MTKLSRVSTDKGRTFARNIKHSLERRRRRFASKHSRQGSPQPMQGREGRKQHWLKGIRP